MIITYNNIKEVIVNSLSEITDELNVIHIYCGSNQLET